VNALTRVTDALISAGSSQRFGGNWHCPGSMHSSGDRNPSLSVSYNGRTVRLKCHTGCSTEDILEILGMTMTDLFDEPLIRREVARYKYLSGDGEVLFAKIRMEPKDFRIKHPVGDSWEGGLGDIKRVIYNLPKVLSAARIGETIWVVEGEKDADKLDSLGFTATCNFEGAGTGKSKWKPEYSEFLRGAGSVIIVADRDDPGIAHAKGIAASLNDIVPEVRIVQSRTTGKGDDISDHLDAGYTTDQLVPLEEPSDIAKRIRRGGCILDAPKVPMAVWGEGEDVLWAMGQSLIIAGHDGTGKTTLAGNLIRGRLGLGSGMILGLPVLPGKRNVLVLMMDRPMQAMSSLARLFGESDRDILEERLRVWEGPPPEDLAANPEMLAHLCQLADADTCIVDSLKDAAIPLTEDAVGAGWNRARQAAIIAGTELLELHHPRKPSMMDLNKPPELSDLYGSRWIPAGIGSAIVLHGRAGEPYVKLFHRKPIVALLGPWDMLIQENGEVILDEAQGDLLGKIARQGKKGVTCAEVALMLYESDTRNEIERARRTLEKLLREGHVSKLGGTKGGDASIYRSITPF
jgi:5S rRNA maturation endonuclease (ribonuclease M5)